MFPPRGFYITSVSTRPSIGERSNRLLLISKQRPRIRTDPQSRLDPGCSFRSIPGQKVPETTPFGASRAEKYRQLDGIKAWIYTPAVLGSGSDKASSSVCRSPITFK